MGNTVSMTATAAAPLAFTEENSYAQLNVLDWTNVSYRSAPRAQPEAQVRFLRPSNHPRRS